MERFWAKVKRGEGCWLWLGCCRPRTRDVLPYGQFRLDGQMRAAHRVSWQLTHGGIPEGLLVLHSCDNPMCVNPAHLHLGDHRENMHEMAARQRASGRAGISNPNARLTLAEVDAIRALVADGFSTTEIGRHYRVHHTHVSRIARSRAWRSRA
jgi:hypothetical protein